MKVFLCETIHPEAYRLLSEHAEIISSRERMGEADALISRVISVGAAEMDAMPGLKVIAVHGTGTDGIDLAEAKKRGIRVVYAPHMNANAVAELNVTLLLAVMRKIVYARQLIDSAGREGCASGMTFAAGNAAPEDAAKWQQERMAFAQGALRGHELRGKTAGFAGFGAIGSRTAEILHYGFGMECLAWSPSLTPERAAKHGSRAASSAEEVFHSADVVFLALPLNEKTRGIAGRECLAEMKKGAVLINASRAGLVDEEALQEALKSGHLGGAASDVLQEEFPGADHPLLQFPNFVVTPHIGANTDEALYEVGMCCVRQILDVLAGKAAEYPVV